MKSSLIKMGFLLGLVGVMLASCSRSVSPTLTKITATPAAPGFPTGSFVSGEYSQDFRPDGTFTSSGPQGSETGTYTASGGQVVLITKSCGNVKGSYSWDFDGESLVFKVIDDQCTNRLQVITSAVWLKH